jgi:hypothetical protein
LKFEGLPDEVQTTLVMLSADATAHGGYTTLGAFFEQLRFNYHAKTNVDLFESNPQVGYNSAGHAMLFALKE